MARRIADADMPAAARTGRKPMYPWDDWFDGALWELVHGEDFNCTPRSFRTNAFGAFRQRGLRAQGLRLQTRWYPEEKMFMLKVVPEVGRKRHSQ